MTNVAFDSLEQYKDIETLNFYKVKTESGVSHQQMMDAIHENSRDNARTPMHWSAAEHGGFSQVAPWIEVNPNYPEINVAQALADSDSIFYHYQKLIALRKQHPAIVYGDFTPLFEEHESVFAYLRTHLDETLLVINNFSDRTVELALPDELQNQAVECLICNYEKTDQLGVTLSLKPYQSFAFKLK